MPIRDPSRATAADLADPGIEPAMLAILAQARPDLWPHIIAHPRCYPDLRVWIIRYGEQAGVAVQAQPVQAAPSQPAPSQQTVPQQQPETQRPPVHSPAVTAPQSDQQQGGQQQGVADPAVVQNPYPDSGWPSPGAAARYPAPGEAPAQTAAPTSGPVPSSAPTSAPAAVPPVAGYAAYPSAATVNSGQVPVPAVIRAPRTPLLRAEPTGGWRQVAVAATLVLSIIGAIASLLPIGVLVADGTPADIWTTSLTAFDTAHGIVGWFVFVLLLVSCATSTAGLLLRPRWAGLLSAITALAAGALAIIVAIVQLATLSDFETDGKEIDFVAYPGPGPVLVLVAAGALIATAVLTIWVRPSSDPLPPTR